MGGESLRLPEQIAADQLLPHPVRKLHPPKAVLCLRHEFKRIAHAPSYHGVSRRIGGRPSSLTERLREPWFSPPPQNGSGVSLGLAARASGQAQRPRQEDQRPEWSWEEDGISANKRGAGLCPRWVLFRKGRS